MTFTMFNFLLVILSVENPSIGDSDQYDSRYSPAVKPVFHILAYFMKTTIVKAMLYPFDVLCMITSVTWTSKLYKRYHLHFLKQYGSRPLHASRTLEASISNPHRTEMKM